MTTKDAYADALGLVLAAVEKQGDMLAPAIARMDDAELRRTLLCVLALVDLRGSVGLDQESTADWARWLLRHEHHGKPGNS